MEKSKIETYLGFCIRAGKAVFGVDYIEQQKKGVKLIIVDEMMAENSLKKILKEQQRFSCPLYVTQKEYLGELLHRPTVKAVGIKDENLAAAIESAVPSEPKLKLYSGGIK